MIIKARTMATLVLPLAAGIFLFLRPRNPLSSLKRIKTAFYPCSFTEPIRTSRPRASALDWPRTSWPRATTWSARRGSGRRQRQRKKDEGRGHYRRRPKLRCRPAQNSKAKSESLPWATRTNCRPEPGCSPWGPTNRARSLSPRGRPEHPQAGRRPVDHRLFDLDP